MTRSFADYLDLIQAARPTSDDDWGSTRQIEAENALCDALREDGLIDPDDYDGAKATTDEMLDDIAQRLEVLMPGAIG